MMDGDVSLNNFPVQTAGQKLHVKSWLRRTQLFVVFLKLNRRQS